MNSIPPSFLPDLYEDVHQALRLWHTSSANGSPLTQLQGYQQLLRNDSQNVRQVTNQLLLTELDELTHEQSELATLVRLRFVDDLPVRMVANKLNLAEGTVLKKQQEGLTRLADSLRRREWVLQSERRDRLQQRLSPAAYTQLVGVDRHLAQLAEQLHQPAAPWLIAIEGIGGLGKTALADQLLRSLINDPHWVDMAWVTARQQIFNGGGAIKTVPKPALTSEALFDALVQQLWSAEASLASLTLAQKQAMLQQRLRAEPHLIVIDNLETLLDVESLLGSLRELVNPTKFLLTSRISRYHEADIFHFTLPELNATDALALVRQEAQMRNQPELAAASDADLQPIYATVGGNPLALRLVVGQTHVHALDQVLANLHEAQGQRAEQLYRYIYWQAWHNLEPMAQQTLLLMPLVTESGGDLAYLTQMAAAAGLSAANVSDALDHLVALSLVDSRGNLHERRYTIHALTRTFLQQQVLRWRVE
jgi:hypothetical protein